MSQASRWVMGLVLALLVMIGGQGTRQTHRSRSRRPTEALEKTRSQAWDALVACLPAERGPQRRALARACEALAYHPDTAPGPARAHLLEAARWWSAACDPRAQLLYQELVAEGDDGVRDRARLELAHIERRAGDLLRALADYERIASDVRVSRSCRDTATWWYARTYEGLGETSNAERTWSRLARDARDPCLRVRAWDRLGCSYMARGAHELACETLQRCVVSCAEFIDESTPLGARVRAAIESMTLRRRLGEITRTKKALPNHGRCGS